MTSSPNWISRAGQSLLRRDNQTVSLHVAFGVFALATLYFSFRFVPWRDESQAWLMARDLSPWGLFVEARHDGHPVLWHLCLQLLQVFGINFWGMFVLNWLFIVAAIWLLFYHSALPLIARYMFAFCPACLLDVSVNARNYAIGVALTFAAAALYRRAEKKPFWFCVVLFFLANTNVYSAAVVVGIAGQFLLEQAWSFGRGPVSLRPIFTRYLTANLILLAGALLLVAQLAPVHVLDEPTVGRPVLHLRPGRIYPDLRVLLLVLPALALFSKGRGFPRIVGGILIFALVLVPAMLYGCKTRHAFMIVAGTVYFLWIYLDDILEKNLARKTLVLVLATFLICLASIAAQPGNILRIFRHSWDSTNTARAIIDHHLDDANTLMVVTEPDFTTPLLMQLKNIRTDYGPPPYPPGPMSFADFFYTRMKKDQVPTLEDIKPVVLKLAAANPTKTILVVSSDPENNDFNDHDPNYVLVPVYESSPVLPAASRWEREYFQVYVLKR